MINIYKFQGEKSEVLLNVAKNKSFLSQKASALPILVYYVVFPKKSKIKKCTSRTVYGLFRK